MATMTDDALLLSLFGPAPVAPKVQVKAGAHEAAPALVKKENTLSGLGDDDLFRQASDGLVSQPLDAI